MSSIGGLTFAVIDGPCPELAGIDSVGITRPGVAGKAFWQTGITARPYTLLSTSLHASASAIGTRVTAVAALRGALVTYVDDLGTTWYFQKVWNVRTVRRFKVLGSTDPSPFVLELEWEMEHIYIP